MPKYWLSLLLILGTVVILVESMTVAIFVITEIFCVCELYDFQVQHERGKESKKLNSRFLRNLMQQSIGNIDIRLEPGSFRQIQLVLI